MSLRASKSSTVNADKKNFKKYFLIAFNEENYCCSILKTFLNQKNHIFANYIALLNFINRDLDKKCVKKLKIFNKNHFLGTIY